MERTRKEKIEAITPRTLVGGVDIAKNIHWARFVDYRGIEQCKAIKFSNNKEGFELIVTKITRLCKEKKMTNVVIGMEPTGPYWKALGRGLEAGGIQPVLVSTLHTKRSKELDDNSPTKNDKKDALVIANLVKEGRYSRMYLPTGEYAELRTLTSSRKSVMKRKNSIQNRIIGLLDEYFPEYVTVFKNPLKGKASLQILKSCPFPAFIQEKGVTGVLGEIRKAVSRTVGPKKAEQLVEAAKGSVGVVYGLEAARQQMVHLSEELELLSRQLEELELSMKDAVKRTGYSEYVLGISGMGVVTLASLLGEIGDPKRFSSPRQIHRLAGYNLIENSSGKNKSGTTISKRGRKGLRALLFRIAMVMVADNNEMKQLYRYLKTRERNPLKGKQALIVIAKKIITIIYTLIRKREPYRPEMVFGQCRREQLGIAA